LLAAESLPRSGDGGKLKIFLAAQVLAFLGRHPNASPAKFEVAQRVSLGHLSLPFLERITMNSMIHEDYIKLRALVLIYLLAI